MHMCAYIIYMTPVYMYAYIIYMAPVYMYTYSIHISPLVRYSHRKNIEREWDLSTKNGKLLQLEIFFLVRPKIGPTLGVSQWRAQIR